MLFIKKLSGFVIIISVKPNNYENCLVREKDGSLILHKKDKRENAKRRRHYIINLIILLQKVFYSCQCPEQKKKDFPFFKRLFSSLAILLNNDI